MQCCPGPLLAGRWGVVNAKRPLGLGKAEPAEIAQVLNRVALRSEEHTSELQSRFDLVCRLLLEKKKFTDSYQRHIPSCPTACQFLNPTEPSVFSTHILSLSRYDDTRRCISCVSHLPDNITWPGR